MSTTIKSPSVGSIAAILVENGASVSPGDELLVLEVMKMQIPIVAPLAGQITAIRVEVQALVQEGDVLLTIG